MSSFYIALSGAIYFSTVHYIALSGAIYFSSVHYIALSGAIYFSTVHTVLLTIYIITEIIKNEGIVLFYIYIIYNYTLKCTEILSH
jgi:hypothetical protein